MIQAGPTMRILVATQPVDFRKGIEGLAAICRRQLEQDPMTGCAFVFRNRKGTAIKILLYDGQGYWLCQKRLSTGRFLHWPSGLGLHGLLPVVCHPRSVQPGRFVPPVPTWQLVSHAGLGDESSLGRPTADRRDAV